MNKNFRALMSRFSMTSAATTLCLSLGLTAPARASSLFTDNFNANATGLNAIPTSWTIANDGTVDLISNDFYSLRPEFASHGVYVDLDGSTSGAGLLTNLIGLIADQAYTLQFALAGNQRNSNADIVTIQFGTATRQITVDPNALFATYSLPFTPVSSGAYAFSFLDAGPPDMQGALLDDVKIFTGIPPAVPTPLPLLGIGVALNIRRLLRRGQRTRLG